MAGTFEWALRFGHIAAAGAWAGGAILWSLFLSPRLLARAPPSLRRPVLNALGDIVAVYFSVVGPLTLGFGLWLFADRYGWANVWTLMWKGGEYGRMFIVAGVLGVLVLVVGFSVVVPSTRKMRALLDATPNGPPPPEAQARLAALGKRLGLAGIAIVVLVLGAFAAMTYAVNLVR